MTSAPPLVLGTRDVGPKDGGELWRLAKAAGGLDVNTPYAYMLWTREFADSTVVAEQDGRLVGFATGFRPPSRPENLFVWQIAVHPDGRGHGVASRLLDALVEKTGARHLEATVDPANGPSRSLFSAFARRHGAKLVEEPYMEADDFPTPDHAPEPLVRIGPLEATA